MKAIRNNTELSIFHQFGPIEYVEAVKQKMKILAT